MSSQPSPHELLGVALTASEREIRRAYRRRVVSTHRTRVLDLVERLAELTRAYETLRNAPRASVAEAKGRASPGSRSPSVSPGHPGVRSEAARELQRHSLRVGAAAQRENAALVTELSTEFDRRESAARRAQERSKRLHLAMRLLGIAFLTALAVMVARHLVGL